MMIHLEEWLGYEPSCKSYQLIVLAISLAILLLLSKIGIIEGISKSQEELLLSFATDKEKLMLERAESCGRRKREASDKKSKNVKKTILHCAYIYIDQCVSYLTWIFNKTAFAKYNTIYLYITRKILD